MQSMEEIYLQHSRTVYRYLLSLTRDAELSEELTQETFYQAVKGAERFDGSCKVTTWLCAIAKNLFYAHLRKNKDLLPPQDDSAAAPSAEARVMADAGKVEILKQLHCLPDAVREVMYLRLFGDLSFAEIGDVLAITENCARVTYYRGKEKLRREFEKNG